VLDPFLPRLGCTFSHFHGISVVDVLNVLLHHVEHGNHSQCVGKHKEDHSEGDSTRFLTSRVKSCQNLGVSIKDLKA